MQTENHAFDEAVRQCHRLQAAHAAMTKDTTEEEGVYYALVDALAAAVSCPVSTASDLLAKLDIYDRFRAESSVYVDNAEELVKQQIAALLAEVRNVLTAEQSIPILPPFQPNNSPAAKMPDGGTYREEPAEWRGRLWSWGDASDICINWLIEVSQTLGLVESRAGDDEHHGPIALAHDRLLETIDELRKLKAEIRLFHSDDDAPVVGTMGHDQDKVSIPPEVLAGIVSRKKQQKQASEDPAAKCEPPTKADLFPAALARYQSAAALRERLRDQYGTEEADAAIGHEGDRYREAMLTEAVTVADVLAKLRIFEGYRCDDGGSMDRQIEGEIVAAFGDVRNVLSATILSATTLEVSPSFAARVQAWRVLRDRYFAAEAQDDATMDPLHDAKQKAYDAMLEEPVQSFGDVLAMARTIREEDQHGTKNATHYEPAFDALIEAVESLAVEG